MAHVQSDNSVGIKTMDDYPLGRSQWHVLMYYNNMVFLLCPPYRPMGNSIALGLMATKQEGSRCWGFKNTVTSKGPDITKWGSGSLHAMPAGAEGS